MRLKETHLPDLFRSHSRSGDVRHRARRKFEPRIRGVDFVRENRDTDGVNVCDFNVFADQPLHDIEIVNHQVEHDVDVQRARSELAHAMNLKIDWLANVWTQRDHRRIETFEVPNL